MRSSSRARPVPRICRLSRFPKRTCLLHVTALLVSAVACGSPSSPPSIELVTAQNGAAYIQVENVAPSDLSALDAAKLSSDEWPNVLRVAVGPDAPPKLGSYAIEDGGIRFTPAFPLDAGRRYVVRFDTSTIAGAEGAPMLATVGLPASTRVPSTTVSHVYPSSDVVPENLLRMYVEFSGPMGRPSGITHMKLLDD